MPRIVQRHFWSFPEIVCSRSRVRSACLLDTRCAKTSLCSKSSYTMSFANHHLMHMIVVIHHKLIFRSSLIKEFIHCMCYSACNVDGRPDSVLVPQYFFLFLTLNFKITYTNWFILAFPVLMQSLQANKMQ